MTPCAETLKPPLPLATGGRLHLVYQPRVDLQTGELRTVEAPVRWRRPDGSLQMPDDFIPEAEENGDIVVIGTWVLDEAVRQAAAWHRSGRTITGDDA